MSEIPIFLVDDYSTIFNLLLEEKTKRIFWSFFFILDYFTAFNFLLEKKTNI
jgi:hypothetical protein